MGGHGGLNILPQKKWHVFNYDNRLKVEQDQARETQLKKQKEDTAHTIQTERVFNTLREQAKQPLKREEAKEAEGNAPTGRMQKQEGMKSALCLGQTASRGTPWYSVPATADPTYDFSAAQTNEFYSVIPKKEPRHKHHSKSKALPKPSKPSIDQLRAARIAREAAERRRTDRLLQDQK